MNPLLFERDSSGFALRMTPIFCHPERSEGSLNDNYTIILFPSTDLQVML